MKGEPIPFPDGSDFRASPRLPAVPQPTSWFRSSARVWRKGS